MALKINNPEANTLARELAHTTGETVSQAVINAIRERLERIFSIFRGDEA